MSGDMGGKANTNGGLPITWYQTQQPAQPVGDLPRKLPRSEFLIHVAQVRGKLKKNAGDVTGCPVPSAFPFLELQDVD